VHAPDTVLPLVSRGWMRWCINWISSDFTTRSEETGILRPSGLGRGLERSIESLGLVEGWQGKGEQRQWSCGFRADVVYSPKCRVLLQWSFRNLPSFTNNVGPFHVLRWQKPCPTARAGRESLRPIAWTNTTRSGIQGECPRV
jgi:hypothetical protein